MPHLSSAHAESFVKVRDNAGDTNIGLYRVKCVGSGTGALGDRRPESMPFPIPVQVRGY